MAIATLEKLEIPVIEAVGLKHARIMEHPNGIRVKIGIYHDGVVCSIVERKKGGHWEEDPCYTYCSSPGQEAGAWAFISNLSHHGFKEYSIPVEE